MTPLELPGKPANQWAMSDGKTGLLVYREGAASTQVDLGQLSGTFLVRRINPKTGALTDTKETVKGGRIATLSKQDEGAEVVWLIKK
jgi:hypothetical protein